MGGCREGMSCRMARMFLRASTTQLRYSACRQGGHRHHNLSTRPANTPWALWVPFGDPPAQPSWEGQCSHLALRSRRGHFAEALLLARVRGVLRQLVQDVGAGRVGDVQVVGQGCPVGCGAGEGMLLVGFLWRSGERKKNEKPSNLVLLC